MELTQPHWKPTETIALSELSVGQLLERAAERWPDRLALVSAEPAQPRREWTYKELLSDARRAAEALLAYVDPGDHVAIWSPNRPEWVILEYAAGLVGVVLVTVNPAFRSQELAYVIRQSQAKALFFVEEYRGNPMAEHLSQVRPELPTLSHAWRLERWGDFVAEAKGADLPGVDPAGPAQIQYTSGTTGFPKGALLSHRGIVNNARLSGERLQVTDEDVYLNYMPLFHTGGCVVGTLIPAWYGIPHVLMQSFQADVAVETIEAERCTMLGGVPTMFIAMLEAVARGVGDTSSLRSAWTGGATVSPELVRRIENDLGPQLSIVFGQTETSPTITQTRLVDSAEDKANTVGQPLPHTEVKIIDSSSGHLVGLDEPGELCARGYLTMNGYHEMPDETAETIDAEGWLHTGDLCSMDRRGYVRVTGRLKEMIIRGGENIYPKEIEDVLFGHPGVAEVAVVGVPDERLGEQPAAFVRRAAGSVVTEDELFTYVRKHLAPHKTPRLWRFVESLPMTPSGKIQKYVLREGLEKDHPAS